jgi:hypothetical protein
MDRDARARMRGGKPPDRPRQQTGSERRLAGDAQGAGAEFADLSGGVAQVVESRLRTLDLAGEGLPLRRRHGAAMPAHEQGQAEVGFELRHRAADMRLADSEGSRRPRHPAMAHHGAEEIEMGRVHHA